MLCGRNVYYTSIDPGELENTRACNGITGRDGNPVTRQKNGTGRESFPPTITTTGREREMKKSTGRDT